MRFLSAQATFDKALFAGVRILSKCPSALSAVHLALAIALNCYAGAGALMDIHCVVTGQDESGKSIIIRNAPIKPVSLALLPGYEFHRIWGSDSIPELPSDGTPPPQPLYFPPKSGFRFAFFTIPPDMATSVDQIDVASALEEIRQKLPGMMDVLEPDHPGMHTTDTVDFDVIVSGEVYLDWTTELRFFSKRETA
jgi:hypothetical protein